mgnify:CR=1 FL=1
MQTVEFRDVVKQFLTKLNKYTYITITAYFTKILAEIGRRNFYLRQVIYQQAINLTSLNLSTCIRILIRKKTTDYMINKAYIGAEQPTPSRIYNLNEYLEKG